MTPIPTMYRGVRMRSRLEARWAAFFDALGWPWLYEPYDLDGWIPDFGILFDAGELVVEVKPAATLADLKPAAGKAERSGWTGEVLLVGAGLLDVSHANPVVGLLGEQADTPDGRGLSWGSARALFCLSCGGLSVLHEDGSWRCRACGADGGNAHVGAAEGLEEAWVTAGNRVQWRAA